ncbi:MAG: hypothetical protein IJQ21_06225 [Lachnospiraceae bacterium]|nr:hypothetical protein [Lachnospiraceae bacterium]
MVDIAASQQMRPAQRKRQNKKRFVVYDKITMISYILLFTGIICYDELVLRLMTAGIRELLSSEV